ncbi:hypothetical protein ABT381_35445, partial [Streptomyces sp. NPDC000151]
QRPELVPPGVPGLREAVQHGSGAAVAALMIWAGSYAPAALHPPAVPLTAPELPLWPALSVLVGLVPAFVAPVPPDERRTKNPKEKTT